MKGIVKSKHRIKDLDEMCYRTILRNCGIEQLWN
jgi:hypothetical protein